jgi:pantoate--beta-alanine ligase
MQVIRTTPEMATWSALTRNQGQRIGFVPTMGYLHEGHLSLVKLARERCDKVVLSIFVNPTQFLPGEDMDTYPRDFERDQALCQKAGVDVIFLPPVSELYAIDHSVMVDETRLSVGLCGVSRPGHFRGVVTIVAKLFNIIQADVAVFGQKDAQQVRIIKRMVRDLNFPVNVVVGSTIRERDGLAMSSRNKYLSASERKDALCLRRALDRAEILFTEGERRVDVLRKGMLEIIAAVPSAAVDYIEIVDDDTLDRLVMIDRRALVVMAVRVGQTRLLDNAVLEG